MNLLSEICAFPVSRETQTRLRQFAGFLAAQRFPNLVSAADRRHIWRRHILDSAQLMPLLPRPPFRLADFGSGGGLPALVLAILLPAACEVRLIESRRHKAAFLRRAARFARARLVVEERRIEAKVLRPPPDVITARALAPLSQLLPLLKPHCRFYTRTLLPKGKNAAQELTQAGRYWKLVARIHTPPARLARRGRILEIRHCAKLPRARCKPAAHG